MALTSSKLHHSSSIMDHLLKWAVLLVFYPGTLLAYWSQLDILSFTNLNATGPLIYDFYMTRVSRQQIGISGTLIVGTDKEGITMDAIGMFRPKADGPFTMLPYRSPRKPICELVDEYYVQTTQKQLKGISDFPQVELGDPKLCDMFIGVSAVLCRCAGNVDDHFVFRIFCCRQKTFTFTNYIFDPKPVPKMMQKGYYKLLLRVFDKNDVLVAGAEVMVQLS